MPGYNNNTTVGMQNRGPQSMNYSRGYSGEYDFDNSYPVHLKYGSTQNTHGQEQSHQFGF